MNGFVNIDDFYRRGPLASHVDEHRASAGPWVNLFMLSPPAGHHPKPATPDFNLVLTLGVGHRASVDIGAGRWRKLHRPGDLGLMPPDVDIDIVADDPHKILVVSLPKGLVRDKLAEAGSHFADFGRLHDGTFSDALVEQLCRRMWIETKDGGALGSLFLDSAVAMLVALLGRMAGGGTPSAAGKGGLPPRRLKHVLCLIHERCGEDLRLSELAAVANLSPSHFVRSFRAETGMSPHRYLVQTRVERAKGLLSGTDLTIAQIAQTCGFSSPGHLASWFKRVTGATPLAYRRFD